MEEVSLEDLGERCIREKEQWTYRRSGNDGLLLSEDSKEARVGVGGAGSEEGRRRDLRGAQNMSEVSLSLCVSCFAGDKITFFKRKRWYGSVLFF